MLLLSGCTRDSLPEEDTGGLKIVASIFPAYDFARQICTEEDTLHLLIAPGMDSHSYSPSPQDIIAIEDCDIFIYVGGSSDTWLDDILSSIDLSEKQIVRMMDCVDLLEEGHPEQQEHSHGEEENHVHEQELVDEHVWTSPRNAMRITEKISSALQAAAPQQAMIYEEKCAAYLEQLEDLDARFRDLVKNAARKRLVFGDRFPLRYFVNEYGLDYQAAYIGCSTEAEPSAAMIAELIDLVREEQIPVILKLEMSNDNIAKTIAADSGADIRIFQSCHTLSKEDFEAGKSYISLMEENLIVLEEALN
ncbi:MAG: metal ABC transporter substrate-binding protein [Bacillota bacterium]|nr:metal ABC transporter substrate-binding protein [Bacillota bacterium]